MPQRCCVARVADRSFGPAGLRRAVGTAPGAGHGGPRRAGQADRPLTGSEAAFPPRAARAAVSFGHLVAVHAHVRVASPGADGDRGGLAASPAPAQAAFPAAAPLADRLTVAGAPGDRVDRVAARAPGGAGAVSAPGAHASQRRAGQRPAGPAARRASRDGKRRAAGDELADQAADAGRSARAEGVRIGGQSRSEAAQRGGLARGRVHRGGYRLLAQRPVPGGDAADHLVAPARRAERARRARTL